MYNHFISFRLVNIIYIFLRIILNTTIWYFYIHCYKNLYVFFTRNEFVVPLSLLKGRFCINRCSICIRENKNDICWKSCENIMQLCKIHVIGIILSIRETNASTITCSIKILVSGHFVSSGTISVRLVVVIVVVVVVVFVLVVVAVAMGLLRVTW